MKRLILILISLSFVTVTGCGPAVHNDSSIYKSDIPVYIPNKKAKLVGFNGSEPQGFNGIKWETQLSSLGSMKRYRKEQSYGGIEYYVKGKDVFKLGNGKLVTPQYGFLKEKFYVGLVTTQGLSDWNGLKEVVFSKFGVGAKPFTNVEEYLWVGKNATMALRYDELSQEGLYYIRSDSMLKKVESEM
jgi:hypothetical protein